MLSDYCFTVFNDDDEHGEAYIIQARDETEAWQKLVEEREAFVAELQFVRPHSDNRHKTCAACHERLGPNPVYRNEYYYHEECR